VSGKEKLEVEDAAKRWVEAQNLNKALGS
jgi:osmoprotectant transport system substrate-binding protein